MPPLPRYVQVELAVLAGIREGRYAVGAQLPSDLDLARELGVAPLTLKHAMRRLEQQGLVERRARVGTFVRAAPPTARNIAILNFNATTIDSGLPRETLEAICHEAQARSHQIRPLLMAPPYPPPQQLHAELQAMQVGAVGLLNFLDTDRDYIAALARQMPCVLFNKTLGGLSLPCVAWDVFSAMRQVVERFVQRGRRRIGVGLIHIHNQRYLDTAMAVEAECARHGLPVDKRFWGEGESYAEDSARRWVDRLLAAPELPDALIMSGGAEYLDERLRARGERIGGVIDVAAMRVLGVRRPWPVLHIESALSTRRGAQMAMDILEGIVPRDAIPVERLPVALLDPEEG